MALLQDSIIPIRLHCVSPGFHIIIVLSQITDLTEIAYCHVVTGVMQLFQDFSFRRLRCAAEIFVVKCPNSFFSHTYLTNQ